MQELPVLNPKIGEVGDLDDNNYANTCKLSARLRAECIGGCLFGGAWEDSLRLETDFLNKEQINEHYVKFDESTYKIPIQDLSVTFKPDRTFPNSHHTMFPPDNWTDDTDQMLLLLQYLLKCQGVFDKIAALNFAKIMKVWQESGFSELGDDRCARMFQSTKKTLKHADFCKLL